MTPKEKATELVNKHFDYVEAWSVSNQLENAKQCALITVNEMLDFRNALYINEGSLAHQYLLDIKTEIEKITL